MIRLDATTRKLQAVLAGAVTTNQLPCTVSYSDKTSTDYVGATQLTNTNSTTAVDICAAPGATTVRDIDYLSIRNRDTAAATVTVMLDDNGTDYEIVKAALAVGDQLIYTHGDGWRVIDADGNLKTGGSSGTGDVVGPASATANSLARFDGTTGKLLKDGAVIGTDVASLAANTFTGDQTLSGGAKLIASEVHSIWVPASALIARTTSGAAIGSAESATNKVMIRTLDFDTAASEYAQFTIRMPKSWDEGTVTAQMVWSHASTGTNFGVVWALQAVAFSDGDAVDAAFGGAQTCTDTGGVTNNIYHSPVSSAITIGGTPGEGDLVVFQVYRDVANGSDTLAIDARLHGVLIAYTTEVCTDA